MTTFSVKSQNTPGFKVGDEHQVKNEARDVPIKAGVVSVRVSGLAPMERQVFGPAESILFRMDQVFGKTEFSQWSLDKMISALSNETTTPEELGELFSDSVQFILRSGQTVMAAEMLDGLGALRAAAAQTEEGGDYYWAHRSLGKGRELDVVGGLPKMVFAATLGAADGAISLAELMISSFDKSTERKLEAGLEPDAFGAAIADQFLSNIETLKQLKTKVRTPQSRGAIRNLMEACKKTVRFASSVIGPDTQLSPAES